MVCETRLRNRTQTPVERSAEVRRAIQKLASDLAANRIRPVVGQQGGIAFQGWAENDRSGISDACAYRLMMVQGSPLAKQAIQRAEILSGRTVDRKALAAGWHMHGDQWHKGH